MNATQMEFEARVSSGASPSQADKILARLMATAGEWVAMPELWRVSGAMAVHSRIADLRKRGREDGFSIDHKNERGPDGTTHSFYKLEYFDQP